MPISGLASMGFRVMLPAGGTSLRMLSLTSGGIPGNLKPAFSNSSVASTLPPPPLPTAQRFRPRGGFMRRMATSMSTISPTLCTGTAPSCLSSASNAA